MIEERALRRVEREPRVDLLILRVLVLALLVPAMLLVVYNVGLALASLRRRPSRERHADPLRLRFALVMPAHNEAGSIEHSLRASTELDFPSDRYELVVIADNCSDSTAAIVREHGLRCLERQDPDHRGKGYALRFAFDVLMQEDFDVFVVLDADSWLDSHALRRFSEEIAAGNLALQANDVVANADATAISYALAVGNATENDLYYAPKSDLGWAVSLRGTGIVLHRDVLAAHPWGAFSIVEDLDYSMALYRAGLAVTFLPDTKVYSPFPETLEQLRVQRARWAGGNVQMSKGKALRLLVEGVAKRRWIITDMGLTILSQSRPLLLVLLWAGLALSLLNFWRAGDAFAASALAVSLALNAAFVAYLLWGIARLGITRHRIGLLAQAPAVLGQLVAITVRSAMGGGESGWERTPRS